LYAYANNDPATKVDADGHEVVALVAGCVICPEIFLPIMGAIVTVAIIGAVLDYNRAHTISYDYEKDHATEISMADYKIRTTVKKDSKNHYWTATMRGDYVDIGSPLSYTDAVKKVKKGLSVFTITQGEAEAVAKAAGGNTTPAGPEICKGKENVKGYYYHYHTSGRNGGHVFYLFD
jgi:hypothetical protein